MECSPPRLIHLTFQYAPNPSFHSYYFRVGEEEGDPPNRELNEPFPRSVARVAWDELNLFPAFEETLFAAVAAPVTETR